MDILSLKRQQIDERVVLSAKSIDLHNLEHNINWHVKIVLYIYPSCSLHMTNFNSITYLKRSESSSCTNLQYVI